MISIVDGAVNLSINGPPEILEKIQDHFKWRPNRYFMHPQYIVWNQTRKREIANNQPLTGKGWDGWKRPGKILKGGVFVTGRGWFQPIMDLVELNDWQVDTSGMIANPYKDLDPDDIPDSIIHGSRHMEQWELQKSCIASLLRAGCGRAKITVSGGKTAILCAVAGMIKKYRPNSRILYITPNERLVSQVATEARKFLPGWDVGQYGGAERQKDAVDMVVATAAIMNVNHDKLVKEKWFQSFNGILCDECQYSASPSNQKILTSCKAWFRVGVSDTTKALDPAKHAILTGTFGPVLNETIAAGDLIEMGQIAKPLITVVELESIRNKFEELAHLPVEGTAGWALQDGVWVKGAYVGPAFQLDHDGELKLDKAGLPVAIPGQCYFEDSKGSVSFMDMKWCLLERKYDQCIIKCKERNAYIKAKCQEWSAQGFKTLIIATRTLHVKILEAELAKVCDTNLTRALYGIHTLDERDEAFEWLKKTPGAILVSPLVKVGVSINEIERGIVADYVADHELANQFVGRFIRKKKTGENRAEIVWFHELQHPHYASGSNKVINQLRKIKGYEFGEDEA